MPTIKIIGVGGGGSNILNKIIESGVSGVEFIAVDFDQRSLELSKAPVKIYLQSTFRGLDDCGTDLRQKDVLTHKYEILRAIGAADAVIIVAGLGGGTGSDVSPLILKFAKDKPIFTAGIFNRPFNFEGAHRKRHAIEAIEEISCYADLLTVFSADIVLSHADRHLRGVDTLFVLLNEMVAQTTCNIVRFIISNKFPV
jgi:cell division protein FtsZ